MQSLNLSKNQLIGQHLSLLNHYLPGLVNLSLQDNNLKTYRDIDAISGKKDKLVGLKELLLAGNPLREEMIKKDAEQFKKYVLWFFLASVHNLMPLGWLYLQRGVSSICVPYDARWAVYRPNIFRCLAGTQSDRGRPCAFFDCLPRRDGSIAHSGCRWGFTQ